MPLSPAISSDFEKITLAPDTDEVPIMLIELEHSSLPEPVRLSSDKTELYGYSEESGEPIYCTRHKGNVFIEGSFGFVPPGNPRDGGSGNASFIVAAEPRIIQAIRDIHDGLQLKAYLVLASDPDTVITPFTDLWLTNVTYDSGQIQATLGFNHFLEEPCGRVKFMPSTFSGLFKNGTIIQ